MAIFDFLASAVPTMGATYKMGVVDIGDSSDNDNPEMPNLSSIYTCQKKLAENVSRIPFRLKKGCEIQDSEINDRLVRPSKNLNRQKFWSTIEVHRLNWGNAFVDIRDKKNWKICHPTTLKDYRWGSNGELEFQFDHKLERIIHTGLLVTSTANKDGEFDKDEEWIKNSQLLHFTGISTNGVLGLSPIAALMLNANIQQKAGNTILAFYKNRAVSPMAVQSEVQSAQMAKVMTDAQEIFDEKYSGSQKWGKTINLPPNTKLLPLAMQFADAQLIDTLKFTRDEIASLYGIPQFMFNDVVVQSREIEQQSSEFRSFTIAPISDGYESELTHKLVKEKDEIDGLSIQGDLDIFIETNLKNKVDALSTGITKGLFTPNEAALKAGSKPMNHPWGDKKFLQLQYSPIDQMENNANFVGNKEKIKDPKFNKQE